MVPVASAPSISTRPPVGSKRPATMLKIVLLPQPDGPIRLTKRPCEIDSVTGASATKAPFGVRNVMPTWSRRSFAGITVSLRTTIIQQLPCQGMARIAQQRRLESAGNRLLTLAGLHGVADHRDDLPRACRPREPSAGCTPAAIVEPVAQCRVRHQLGDSGPTGGAAVERCLGERAEAEAIGGAGGDDDAIERRQ